MKNIVKSTALMLLASTFCVSSAVATGYEIEHNYNKEKPAPGHKVDLEKKQIIFYDAPATYLIDNDHVDVVIKGEITTKDQVVDISKLTKGSYMLEIEYKGFIFTEEIVIK